MELNKKITYDPDSGLCVKQNVLHTVFMMVFIATLATSISNPVMPYYAKSFGVGSVAIGYMYSAMNLATFFSTPILGQISDSHGRRLVMLMACFGAGVAGLGQAFAPSFSVLFFFRTFTGIWGGVVTVAQVYVSDISNKEVIKDYLAHLAAVPNFSRTLGPGLGGGLSKFGVGIPILVDGVLSFITGILVFIYVPESPVFLSKQAEKSKKGASDEEHKESPPSMVRSNSGDSTVPFAAHAIGLSNFFNGIQIGMSMAMLAISMLDKFQWDALHVGYLMLAQSMITLATTIWITTRLIRSTSARQTSVIGGCLIALGYAGMVSQNVWLFLVASVIRAVGMGLRQGSIGTVSAEISNSSNRGKVFSLIQIYVQAGSFVGPMIGGYVAKFDAKAMIWWVSAATTLIAALLMLLVKEDPKKNEDPLLAELRADIGIGTLEDEVGSAADYDDLAQYVGGLLTKRHYRWITNKERIYAMIDKMLPELSSEGEKHAEELGRLLMYAEKMSVQQ